jgi:hypothetical protein
MMAAAGVADEEMTDAPGARDIEIIQGCGSFDARGDVAGGRYAIDDARDDATARAVGPWLAVAARNDGRCAGSPALWSAGYQAGHRRLPEPDWAQVHRELKRKHVTLQVLWKEYIAEHPGGYRYSRFCDLYRHWEERLPVTMRQTHLAGDKLFVDYAGDTVPVVVDRLTGEIRAAHIFVAVMGASSLSFACASWTKTLADWVDAHGQALSYFGGAPRLRRWRWSSPANMSTACRYTACRKRWRGRTSNSAGSRWGTG